MGGLKDQLLKAGLVNEQQLKRARQAERKEKKQTSPRAQAEAVEQERRRQEQARREKAERDRELNRQRQQEAAEKALAAQVRQLVEAHRIAATEGDTPYHFADGGVVKKLYLSPAIRRQLIAGRLAIVRAADRYELVPAEIATKIRARDASAVIVQNDTPPTSGPAGDDPYAGYEVPDDLIW